jgi:hypothetical protein
MRVRLVQFAGLCLVLFVGLTLTSSVLAQGKAQKGDKATKAAPAGKMSNVQGKVGRIDKDTIVVMIGNNNDNKPGKIGDVKQGYFIACSGSTDDKAQFMAKECVYRDKQ